MTSSSPPPSTAASANTNTSVESVFADYVQYIQDDQQIRDDIRVQLRDLEQTSREVAAVLQKMHQPGGVAKVPDLLKQSRALFETKVRPQLEALTALIPHDQYYRFLPMYTQTLQRLTLAAALTHYLDKEGLVTRESAAQEWLGLKVEAGDGFHLELEDYLGGLILMSNELARFTVNSVTHGDYERPLRISAFLNDLLNGFRLLNLKNDSLRKKFDSLKYDIKKVEEVVYDLSIRGLVKTGAGDAAVKDQGKEGTTDKID